MCIAIYKPKNKIISEATLQECFRSNRDGAGFMYVEKKELKIQKGFFTFQEFYNAYKEHETKQCVIHFRIKTHGPVAEENCHPFQVNQSLGFVHNGIISGFGSVEHSDTRDFNAKILQPLVAKWGNLALFQPAMKTLLESRIGYSKLIFLDRHGNVDIFNEEKGVWEDEVWYSNTSFRPYVAPVTGYYSGANNSTNKTPPTVWQPRKETPAHQKKDTVPKLYSSKLLEAGKKAFRILEQGETVQLTRAHWDKSYSFLYPTGAVFEVLSINSNYTADLIYENEVGQDEYIEGVPFSKLDFAKVPEDAEDKDEFNSGYYGYSGAYD
jgi:glutamine amidotransferase